MKEKTSDEHLMLAHRDLMRAKEYMEISLEKISTLLEIVDGKNFDIDWLELGGYVDIAGYASSEIELAAAHSKKATHDLASAMQWRKNLKM